MHILKNSTHIRTSRNIKSFRSCRHVTGDLSVNLDRGKTALEDERLAQREARQLWFAQQWRQHPMRSRRAKPR